jgi:hypothetical protein
MKKKIISHLKGDIKGCKKERKYLKKEIKEDEELIKGMKRKRAPKRKDA